MITVTETLQTDAPLARLQVETAAYTPDWCVNLANGDKSNLDMDQPYQRGDVWNDWRRCLLIRSLIQGIPIGAITINDRFGARFHEPSYGSRHSRTPNRNWAYAVVDGKQRFTTLVKWALSELTVPASWFPRSDILSTEETPDGQYVRMSGLNSTQRRKFSNRPLAIMVAKVQTLAEEQQIFNLINFGGVAQGEVDT